LEKYILNQEDFNKLLDYPKKLRHRLMLRLLYATGIRTKELVTIKVKDVDTTNKTIRILDCKKKIYFTLPIDSETNKMLKEYMVSNLTQHIEYLFSNGNGGHVTTKSIQKCIRAWSKKLNYKDNWCPRFFRYRLARLWIIKKGSLTDLQSILRHTQINTTFRYVEKIKFTSEIENLKREYDRIINDD